ncbi:MAG: hypothetical protein EOP47_25460 [Sphingobacteriaceae bacterium]|nr:MAG: hypothetical protein EOP47_25460 [Sphingobacteriaceae bacterium]
MLPAKQYNYTRIAPTPSGYLHLGNVLSFAVTACLAQKHHAKILLRIDDLDQQRVNRDYVQDIFDTLDFLQIPWHNGPRNYDEYKSEYSQLHRMEMYQKALDQLKDAGKLFACTCSRAQLAEHDAYPGTCRNKALPFEADNTCWRLQTDNVLPVTVNTITGELITALPLQMRDVIVRKKDGFPAYQLASVLDDIYYNIDLSGLTNGVIRSDKYKGEAWKLLRVSIRDDDKEQLWFSWEVFGDRLSNYMHCLPIHEDIVMWQG